MTRAGKRIGLAQIANERRDLAAAVDQHLEWIAAGRERECDVLLFPELSLVPYACGSRTLEIALDRSSDEVMALARASTGMATVFGFVEEGPAAQFYNSVAVVRDGALAFLHRKINLPTYGQLEEGKHFAAGRYVETFELGPPWRLAVLNCADIWNPALVHLAALHGTTLLLVPIASTAEAVGAEFDNPAGWDIVGRFYAMIYGMPIVLCNRVGSEDGMTFWGGSALVDPFGNVIAHAGAEETLLVEEVDFDAVRRARHRLPTLRDSNLALVQHEINRLSDLIGVPSESGRL